MGEAIPPEKLITIEDDGTIKFVVRMKVDEGKYEGKIPVLEATKQFYECLKEERKDRIKSIE